LKVYHSCPPQDFTEDVERFFFNALLISLFFLFFYSELTFDAPRVRAPCRSPAFPGFYFLPPFGWTFTGFRVLILRLEVLPVPMPSSTTRSFALRVVIFRFPLSATHRLSLIRISFTFSPLLSIFSIGNTHRAGFFQVSRQSI